MPSLSYPSKFTPRQFQIDAIDALSLAWQEHQRVLHVSPTGSGKAVIAAMLIQRCLDGIANFAVSTPRVLMLVNREELLQQALDKIQMVTGRYAAIERGEDRAPEGADIVVATIQSMCRRLARYPQDHFGLVIVDEAHLFATNQAKDVLDWFCLKQTGGYAYMVGFTATPQTKGKRALANIYGTIGYEITLPELVKQGMLSNIKVQTAPLSIDLRHIKRTGPDIDEEELDKVIRPYFRAVAEAMQKYGPERKWLCFLPLVKTSKAFAQILNEHGIPAKHIDGESPDRKEILEQFKHDHFRVLTCSSLLTTGYDEPSITGIVNLRPTESRILLTQMLGRGTRIKPDGSPHDDLLVLDFLWQYDLSKLVSPASLVASNDEDEHEMQERLRNGEQQDLLTVHRDVAAERHAKLAKKLAEQERRKGRLVDLRALMEMGFEENAQFNFVLDYEPTMKWHEAKPTEKQMQVLCRMGIDAKIIKDRGHAAAMLDFCISRTKQGLATFKQIHAINRMGGHADINTKFVDASKTISQLMARFDAIRMRQ